MLFCFIWKHICDFGNYTKIALKMIQKIFREDEEEEVVDIAGLQSLGLLSGEMLV